MGALRLSKLSPGQRLLLALGLMLLPSVAVGVIGLLSLHARNQDVHAIAERSAIASAALGRCQERSRACRVERCALRQDGRRRDRGRFFALARRLGGHFDALERFDDGQERSLVRRSRRAWLKAYAAAAPVLRGRRAPRAARQPYPLRRGFHPAVREALRDLERLSRSTERATTAAAAANNDREGKTFGAFLAIFALGAGPALFIGWRIHRSIHRPAERLREAAERIGAGDHHYRVALQPGDELGDLALAFNAMVEKVASSEEVLRRASKQDAIGQLASGIAHDFNNLLVVILNSAHFVEATLAEADPAREDVKEIRRAAERATALTRQLLSFSRPLSTSRLALDLSTLVRQVEPLLVRSIGEHIEVELQLDDALPAVSGDAAQLEQVVLNLALNARDAMPGGGRLMIAAVASKPAPAGGIVGVRLSVSDSGHGMTSETAARALEPLFTTKPPGEGTGLGLATVDRIVRGMRGQLDIATSPGRGTTVAIELPGTRQRPPSPVAPELDLPASRGETILLVEDDNAVRSLVRRILTRAGYSVRDTSQPGEALRMAARDSQSIDLVLSDVVMPEMSGLEMVERINSAGADLRVLFISGYPDSLMAVRHIRREGLPLLEKPFDPEHLRRRVREALEHPAQVSLRGAGPIR